MTLELSGENLRFRHWPISANDVTTAESSKDPSLSSCEVDKGLAAQNSAVR